MSIRINGQPVALPATWQQETLLAFLRDGLGLVGTKFGCGQGLCGACTVLVDGQARRSCQTAAATVQGHAVTTIEGLAASDGTLHPVQQAWLDEAVPQCGFCQAGHIMTTVALLQAVGSPDATQIDAVLNAHLCRCGTQPRMRRAVERAARSWQPLAMPRSPKAPR